MTGTPRRCHSRSYRRTAARTPGFGRPVWIKTPFGSGIAFGGCAGVRGLAVSAFVTNAPRRVKSTRPRYSPAKPRRPEAFITGPARTRPRLWWGASSTILQMEDRPIHARSPAMVAEFHPARLARADAAGHGRRDKGLHKAGRRVEAQAAGLLREC